MMTPYCTQVSLILSFTATLEPPRADVALVNLILPTFTSGFDILEPFCNSHSKPDSSNTLGQEHTTALHH